jgi:hypothetical protein
MSAKKQARCQERCANASPQSACRSVPISHRRDERFPLDDLATEFLKHAAGLVAAAGYSLDEAVDSFKSSCVRIPRRVGRHSRRCPVGDPGQVMTLWYSKSEYLNQRGKPIPLPLHGPAPSVQALVHEVDPRLSVSEALDYLTACKSIKRRGTLFVSTARILNLPAQSPYQSALHLKAAAGLLRTIDHNAHNANQWLQCVAEGPVPEHKLLSAVRDFSRAGSQMAKYADDFILRRAGDQKKRDTQVPLSIGFYVYRGPTEKSPQPASLSRPGRRPRRAGNSLVPTASR